MQHSSVPLVAAGVTMSLNGYQRMMDGRVAPCDSEDGRPLFSPHQSPGPAQPNQNPASIGMSFMRPHISSRFAALRRPGSRPATVMKPCSADGLFSNRSFAKALSRQPY